MYCKTPHKVQLLDAVGKVLLHHHLGGWVGHKAVGNGADQHSPLVLLDAQNRHPGPALGMARAVVKLVPDAVPRAQARNAIKMSVPGAWVPVHEDPACLEAEAPNGPPSVMMLSACSSGGALMGTSRKIRDSIGTCW